MTYNSEEYAEYILNEYRKSIIHLAYTYLKNMNDAQDVAQEVFISLMKVHPDFNDKNHEKAWLFRATINCSLNVIKSSWRKRCVSFDDDRCFNDEFEECDEKLEIKDNLSYLMQEQSNVIYALQQLPQKQRTAIYLRHIEGYTSIEIAQIMNEKKRTVDSFLYRGINALRAYLKGND